MLLYVILSATVIVSTMYLLRQYLSRTLEAGDTPAFDHADTREDGPTDALKAA